MPEKGEKPIGELISELTQELRTLFRQEMELFRTETVEKVQQLAKDAAGIGAGGVVLYTGFLVLVAAIVLGVATFIAAWAAALAVAFVLFVVGFALVQKSRKDLTQMEMKPEQTTESLKETARWAKTLTTQSSTPQRTGFGRRSGTRKAI